MQNKSDKLSPLPPLSKGGNIVSNKTPCTKRGKRPSNNINLNMDGEKGASKIPLIKGDTGGFDIATLKARGLITTGFHLPYNPNLIKIAHLLRNNLTPAEKKLWYSYLGSCKFRVLRQRPVDNYIVDFYCPKYKLVIEIDGDSHFTEEGKAYDGKRTATLERYGLNVIRFQNNDVMNNIEGVVIKIEEVISGLATKKNAVGS